MAAASRFRTLGVLNSLQGLQAKREQRHVCVSARIPAAVEDILAIVPSSNPTPVTTQNLTALLYAAWAGKEPQ